VDGGVLNDGLAGTLAALLGIRIVEADANRVIAELTVRDDLRTVGGPLHTQLVLR
jgi:acyl-coenzyme A thioesterase PaaI-like protein